MVARTHQIVARTTVHLHGMFAWSIIVGFEIIFDRQHAIPHDYASEPNALVEMDERLSPRCRMGTISGVRNSRHRVRRVQHVHAVPSLRRSDALFRWRSHGIFFSLRVS